MLTPSFEIIQDPDFLTILIKAPFTKISDTEIFIEECDFKFYSKPYYLRLNLPGPIIEDGRETAKYDADTGSFTVRVAKVHAGEHFEGLDLLTRLLAPTGQSNASTPSISALGSDSEDAPSGNEDEVEFDWQLEQTPYKEMEAGTGVSIETVRYGFANQRSGVFQRLQSELCGVIDLSDADNTPESERRKLRLADEDGKFDEDHYLADLYDDSAVKELLSYEAPWDLAYRQMKAGTSTDDAVILSNEEKELMKQLPRKHHLLDDCSCRIALLGLVDVIFAYAYSVRVTEGEHNVESSWTICKLSGTLSWLQTYGSIHEVAVTCYRRSLTYPLHRHWLLSRRVFRDVARIFALGRRCLLRCLLDTHQLLRSSSDSRYILDDLYIADYCVWIQSVSPKQLKGLTDSLMKINLSKIDVGFDLELLEQAAKLATDEENDQSSGQQMTDQLAAMSLDETTATVCSAPPNVVGEGDERKMEERGGLIEDVTAYDDEEEASSDWRSSTCDSSSECSSDVDNDEQLPNKEFNTSTTAGD